MPKNYSVDLRKRVLHFIDAGGSKEEACKIFEIGRNTIYLWIRQRKERGTLEPKVRTQWRRRLIDDARLKEYLKSHPDATLAEMAALFSVSTVAIWKALRRMNMIRKKKNSGSRKQ